MSFADRTRLQGFTDGAAIYSQYTITMQRQRLAFRRVSQRAFSDEQLNAPQIDYTDSHHGRRTPEGE